MTPERYKGVKWEDAPEKVREMFQATFETRRGMYIHGEVGTGKTHIAYALKGRFDDPSKGRWSRFWNTTELLREIRRDFDRSPYEKTHADSELMRYDGLLFLDDVGSEKISDWVAETFYMIVNRRYTEMLPTIITSNLPIPALAERIGDRTASRIVEMCEIVELVGPDRRIQNQKKTTINL